MRPDDLLAELKSAAGGVTQSTIDRLRSLGVRPESFAESEVIPFGLAKVEGVGAGLYQPLASGTPCLVIPVVEEGHIIDLCAFRAADPGGWMLRTGLGWCLDRRNVGWHMWHESVRLWSTPLDWLRAGGDGLCVVNWEATGDIKALDVLPHIIADTHELAETLRRALTRPVRLPKISVEGALLHVA